MNTNKRIYKLHISNVQVGFGIGRSYISWEQGYDIDLFAPSGGTTVTTIGLSSDQIRLNAPKSIW